MSGGLGEGVYLGRREAAGAVGKEGVGEDVLALLYRKARTGQYQPRRRHSALYARPACAMTDSAMLDPTLPDRQQYL